MKGLLKVLIFTLAAAWPRTTGLKAPRPPKMRGCILARFHSMRTVLLR